jgi:hypothetical protein
LLAKSSLPSPPPLPQVSYPNSFHLEQSNKLNEINIVYFYFLIRFYLALSTCIMIDNEIVARILIMITLIYYAVCGLVMLELFKLVLKKDTDAYMNRQIGLAVFLLTSYTAEKPISFKTTTEIVPPSNKLFSYSQFIHT